MKVFNSGVDWLTLTQTGVTSTMMTALEELWEEHHLVAEDWGGGGYRGYKCSETGVRYGIRGSEDGGTDEMMVASGLYADTVALSEMDSIDLRCTRIDFQVTVYFDEPQVGLASGLYGRIKASKAVGNSLVGRRKTSLIQSDTGSTLYVGSRKGGRKFFRLYDKSADYEAPLGTIWRQEVQYGRKFADNALWNLKLTDLGLRTGYIIDLVCAEFQDALSWSLQVNQGDSVDLVVEKLDTSGIQSKLQWLRKCVKPVVNRLCSNGYTKEAMRSLGLL